MARGAGEPSTKRAKVDEAGKEEEEDPLVLRKEEVVRLLEEASAKGRGNARAKKELITLCADLEAKNEKTFGGCRLLPELWQKIVDEYLQQNDLLAFAMTCRFFRDTTKDLGRKLETNLTKNRLLELQKSGKMASHSSGWFQWVCDTFEVMPGFESSWCAKVKGAVYEGALVNYAALQGNDEILKWLLEEASAKGKGNARAKKELLTLCADFEAKNEKLLGRLLPELWQKIVDEYLQHNDLLAFAMTCRFFRDTTKDLGKKMRTNLKSYRVLEMRKSGKMAPHTLDWFQWVCDTFEPGFQQPWSMKRVKGAVYEGDLVNYAALQGSVEILRWLMEEKGCELNEDTGWLAGMGGSIEVLEYLRGNGYKFDEGACMGVAEGGHLEVLKFLRGLDPPCPWDRRTCSDAAGEGHLDVLKWARSQDRPCPWDELTCAMAARGGHLDVLKWLLDQDPPCPWDDRTCADAAYGGHLEVLKWLRSQEPPCPWDEWTCAAAAEGGHLEVLKWVRDQDPPCPWSDFTCSRAAKGGRLEGLEWLRAQNPPCPWDSMTCAWAAREGHLEVLKWARSQDPPCPWNGETCWAVAYGGHLDVLKWARSQNPPCPWSRSYCKEKASRGGHQHVIEWIDQQED